MCDRVTYNKKWIQVCYILSIIGLTNIFLPLVVALFELFSTFIYFSTISYGSKLRVKKPRQPLRVTFQVTFITLKTALISDIL